MWRFVFGIAFAVILIAWPVFRAPFDFLTGWRKDCLVLLFFFIIILRQLHSLRQFLSS